MAGAGGTVAPGPAPGVRISRALELHRAGALEAAEQLYREVLVVAPESVDALHYLGALLLQRGEAQQAAELIGAAVALDARQPVAHANLAAALRALGRAEAALASLDRAVALDRRFGAAYVERGNVLLDLGRSEEAQQSFERALRLDPADAAALNGRGNALLAQGQAGGALACFERALLRLPQAGFLHGNRAAALVELGRASEALAACDAALELTPRDAAVLVTRGNALLDLGRTTDALAAYDAALALEPRRARAWNNRGNALYALRRFEPALASFDRALEADDGGAERLTSRHRTRYNRCAVLTELQRTAEAGAAFEALLADAPDFPFVRGRAFHARLGRGYWADYAAGVAQLAAGVAAGEEADVPFSFLAVSDDASLQLACARRFAAATVPEGAGRGWQPRPRGRQGRLRIAYLSADFHEHATAQLAAGLFEAHDRERFEVTGVSFGPNDGSARRARVAAGFEHFIDVAGDTDASVARRLAEAQVDIAVDLKGYTGGSRPAILAQRPAPLQVSFLGYPGTMGADWIDYLIADPVVVPEDRLGRYHESLVRLPGSYQVNDSARPRPPPASSRAALGLPAGGIVFACFNAAYKLNPPLFDVWMRLLGTVPGSVLWLLEDLPEVSARLREEAVRRGIEPGRLVFAPRVGYLAHLARQTHADLFLDTFPVNAHTTASDALWMGLPVLTCAGDAFASRVAASLLTALGVPELVTTSVAEYEALARALALDPARLLALRQRVAAGRTASRLFDTASYCRGLERAFEYMWGRHERGEPPASFDVPSSP